MAISGRPVVGVSFKLLEKIYTNHIIDERQEQDVFRKIKSVSSGISCSASLVF